MSQHRSGFLLVCNGFEVIYSDERYVEGQGKDFSNLCEILPCVTQMFEEKE
jgi:hypothetical protein